MSNALSLIHSRVQMMARILPGGGGGGGGVGGGGGRGISWIYIHQKTCHRILASRKILLLMSNILRARGGLKPPHELWRVF